MTDSETDNIESFGLISEAWVTAVIAGPLFALMATIVLPLLGNRAPGFVQTLLPAAILAATIGVIVYLDETHDVPPDHKGDIRMYQVVTGMGVLVAAFVLFMLDQQFLTQLQTADVLAASDETALDKDSLTTFVESTRQTIAQMLLAYGAAGGLIIGFYQEGTYGPAMLGGGVGALLGHLFFLLLL